MSMTFVATRYARALLAVARERGEAATVHSDLARVREILDALPALQAYCRKGGRSRAAARQCIQTAFIPYVSALVARLLEIAVANGRLASLPYLPEAFARLEDAQAGRVTASITCARQPDQELVTIITERLAARTGRHIIPRLSVDPDLLGGFMVNWTDRLVDHSLRGRLRLLRRTLRAS